MHSIRKDKIDIVKYIIDSIQRHFKKQRIICLILYGSALNESKIEPKDYDLLLLLDRYSKTDYQMLKIVKNNFPVELFIDYKDQILRKGLENYQRGRHGSYFVGCLAYGKCLLGNNFYLSNLDKISRNIMQRDLLFRIEEYFYRIQQHYVNDGLNDNDSLRMVKKYISRICMDLLLYSGELTFVDIHKFHYSQIMTLVLKSVLFSRNDKDLLRKLLLDSKKVNLIGLTIQSLYEVYLNCFEGWMNIYQNHK